MNVDNILENLRKAAELLKDRNTYYAVVIGILGYLIWEKNTALAEEKADNKAAIELVEKEKEKIQAKLDDKDCAQEVRAYKELLDGLQTRTATSAEDQLKALEMERKRTEELNKTYQLLNTNK